MATDPLARDLRAGALAAGGIGEGDLEPMRALGQRAFDLHQQPALDDELALRAVEHAGARRHHLALGIDQLRLHVLRVGQGAVGVDDDLAALRHPRMLHR